MSGLREGSWLTRSLLAAVVVAAATLAFRMSAAPAPPPTEVVAARSAPTPAPPSVVNEELARASSPLRPEDMPVYASTFPHRFDARLRYATNLDLLAPLGTGTANAALYFRDFARVDGQRTREMPPEEKWIAVPQLRASAYAPDEPLLLEAEPWVDQAVMRFYPDHWSADEPQHPLPHLLHFVYLARSWVARGTASRDRETALADFRRAVRLGRLVMQDDVDTITQRIGSACIALGATGIYDLARREANVPLMFVASRVLGEGDAQRSLAARQFNALYGALQPHGLIWRRVEPRAYDEAETIAFRHPGRSARLDAMHPLALAASAPIGMQALRARKALASLAEDPDQIVAARARWFLEHPVAFQQVLRAKLAQWELTNDVFSGSTAIH